MRPAKPTNINTDDRAAVLNSLLIPARNFILGQRCQFAGIAISAILASGCAHRTVTISGISPHPEIPHRPENLAPHLQIEGTPNRLQIQTARSVTIDFLNVHKALEDGFKHGFAIGMPPGGETLVIQVAGIELIAATKLEAAQSWYGGAFFVLAHGGGEHAKTPKAPSSNVVILRYSAELRDGGKMLKALAATAHGTTFFTLGEEDIAKSIESAICHMYVTIAQKLLNQPLVKHTTPSRLE